MLGNIVVGILFGSIILWAFKRAKEDMKNNKCGGCSGCPSKNKCGK